MKTLLTHGRFFISENHFETELLIENERIIPLGSTPDRVIDLEGALVLPGFHDSHLHLYSLGKRLSQWNLQSINSVAQLIHEGQQHLAQQPTDFLEARGWNQDYFQEKRSLNRHDLDQISRDIPIYLVRHCGHVATVNTALIELAGLRQLPHPPGGEIVRDDQGEPTGLLRESAMDLVKTLIPRSSLAQRQNYLQHAVDHLNHYGITSVQSNDIRTKQQLSLLQAIEAMQTDRPQVRYQAQIAIPDIQEHLALLQHFPHTTDFFRTGQLKLFKDGALGSRTAQLSRDYADAPGQRGIDNLPLVQLRPIVQAAEQAGLQVVTHAIGDLAITEVLQAYAQAAPGNPLRHSLIHCQITTPEIIRRAAELHVPISFQPVFLDYDLHIVGPRVGAELAATSYAFKSFADAGSVVGFGSDAPIEDLNPFHGLYCAITRQDLQGNPPGGYLPDQALSLGRAIEHYTYGSAVLARREHELGRLLPGYLADLIVIDRNLFELSPDEVRSAQVLRTMLAGEFLD